MMSNNIPFSKNDLLVIMKNCVAKYNNFIFLGIFASNDNLLIDILRQLNIKKLRHENKIIAIIWNTDKMAGPGIHWVTSYLDLKNNIVCYFDSLANEMNQSILKTLKNLMSFETTLKLHVNKLRFQYKDNSLCGMFVIFFLISRLHGIHYQDFYQSPKFINDDFIQNIFYML
jgi:hypothetical protein